MKTEKLGECKFRQNLKAIALQNTLVRGNMLRTGTCCVGVMSIVVLICTQSFTETTLSLPLSIKSFLSAKRLGLSAGNRLSGLFRLHN